MEPSNNVIVQDSEIDRKLVGAKRRERRIPRKTLSYRLKSLVGRVDTQTVDEFDLSRPAGQRSFQPELQTHSGVAADEGRVVVSR